MDTLTTHLQQMNSEIAFWVLRLAAGAVLSYIGLYLFCHCGALQSTRNESSLERDGACRRRREGGDARVFKLSRNPPQPLNRTHTISRW